MVGGDRGDGLAVVADQVLGKDRTVGDPAAVGGVSGHVGVGHHGPYAGHLDGLRGVDGDDPGVRVREAQHRGPQPAHRSAAYGKVPVVSAAESAGCRETPRPMVDGGWMGVPAAGVAVTAPPPSAIPVMPMPFRYRFR
ncbi:hypothetical protein SANTM175S_06958 [Streptomyces antimycoticus]